MDFETAFEILNDECRRAVVEILRDDSPISRRRLTDRLAARGVGARGDPDCDPHDPATRYEIHVALHHDHLPRLAEAGLVEYDDETVAATLELEAFVEWLGPLDRDAEPTDDSGATDDPESSDDLRDRLLSFYA